MPIWEATAPWRKVPRIFLTKMHPLIKHMSRRRRGLSPSTWSHSRTSYMTVPQSVPETKEQVLMVTESTEWSLSNGVSGNQEINALEYLQAVKKSQPLPKLQGFLQDFTWKILAEKWQNPIKVLTQNAGTVQVPTNSLDAWVFQIRARGSQKALQGGFWKDLSRVSAVLTACF